ncbi:hypothetical protein B0H94_102152 [Salsuginibacillus halophilus]|uniref:Rhodanese-related sulfurtransferase n=2 Tax=Salsuginibacillus halophilus TaxID=517424 RepID=A0A2P8HXJ3_9BACI|nr:hypothetical protein B0H94_102152 [Salsuginibacillus halophilus]
MYAALGFLLLWLMFSLYYRFVPVLGVDHLQNETSADGDVLYVDVRDYQYVDGELPEGEVVPMPLAHLKRHYNTIEQKPIVVIAEDISAKNMSIRWLKRKGYKIQGYCLGKACSPRET